jgi:hypothetical protein
MFDKLKELLNSLEVNDTSKYVQVKNARSILQKIKLESQRLRQVLTEAFKASRKTISHNVTKEEIKDNNLEEVLEPGDEIEIPVEETELVNENSDDFFDKQ